MPHVTVFSPGIIEVGSRWRMVVGADKGRLALVTEILVYGIDTDSVCIKGDFEGDPGLFGSDGFKFSMLSFRRKFVFVAAPERVARDEAPPPDDI